MFEEHDYISKVGDNHRKSYGQYFTHPDIARFMVNWVLESGVDHIHDPGFGLGAFYHAVNRKHQILFTATEIDRKIINYLEEKNSCFFNFIKNDDYLMSWGMKHGNIVCNPPYMRFQKFANRHSVSDLFQEKINLRLSGYTNVASVFLLKSLSELDGTGRLAYIMPIEFLNTGYGEIVKSKLIENRHLFAIIKIDCEKDVFPDAITSICIILYDSKRNFDELIFHTIKKIGELTVHFDKGVSTTVSYARLKANEKWAPYFQEKKIVSTKNLVHLSSYGAFSRGIATGANEFFVLRPSDVQNKKILKDECLPCITKSSHIKNPVFDYRDFEQLAKADSPVFLFSAHTNHSDEAEQYIQYGQKNGFHERFLTKNRNPWYKTERRKPAPLLLGVFSRGGYKIILNRTNILNLTCFHGFQPNLFGTKYIKPLFLYLLSESGKKIVSLAMRNYGDSLDKFEPNDINQALVPSTHFFDKIQYDMTEQAILYIKENGAVPLWVDDIFASLIN